jgi:hypothetical protein
MKKFSNSINQKINTEPKEIKSVDEALELKQKMISLMERFLKVQSYGPVDDRYLSGSVTIEGKEMLAEALLDFLSSDSSEKQIALLESLKKSVNDWEAIDNKIDSIKSKSTSLNSRSKFESLINNYSSDEESLLMVVKEKADNITESSTLKDYIKLVESSKLSSDIKSKMNKIYEARLYEIG